MNSFTATANVGPHNDMPRNGFRPLPHLMGIRYVDEGGDGSGAGGDAGAAGDAANAASQAAADAAAATQAAADASAAADKAQAGKKFEDLDPATQNYVRKHREDAKTAQDDAKAAHAENATLTAQLKTITDALGITKGDEKPDPDKLQKELADTQAAQTGLARENAVLRYAGTAGANADLLLDSKGFAKTLEGLDPTDAEAVKGKITDWVQKHPTYKAATADAGSGTGGAGTGGSSDTPRAATLEQAMAGAVAAQRK